MTEQDTNFKEIFSQMLERAKDHSKFEITKENLKTCLFYVGCFESNLTCLSISLENDLERKFNKKIEY